MFISFCTNAKSHTRKKRPPKPPRWCRSSDCLPILGCEPFWSPHHLGNRRKQPNDRVGCRSGTEVCDIRDDVTAVSALNMIQPRQQNSLSAAFRSHARVVNKTRSEFSQVQPPSAAADHQPSTPRTLEFWASLLGVAVQMAHTICAVASVGTHRQ